MAEMDYFLSALLHCNGEDGATVITDETGFSWSPNGDPIVTTEAWKRFGFTSLDFWNNDRSLTSESSSVFAFGTGDFTLEAYVKLRSAGDYAFWIFTIDDAQGDTVLVLEGQTQEIRFYQRTDDISYGSGLFVPLDGEGHHIVMERENGAIRFFLDGKLGTVYHDEFTERGLGFDPCTITLGGLAGWMDEIRISRGIARYHDSFTPQAYPFNTDYPALVMLQLDNVDHYIKLGDSPKMLTAISVELVERQETECIKIEGYKTERPKKDDPDGVTVQSHYALIMEMDLRTAYTLAELLSTFTGRGG